MKFYGNPSCNFSLDVAITRATLLAHLKIHPHTQTCMNADSIMVKKKKHSSDPCRIDLDFNGYYTSFPKEKENIETRGKWNPTSKPKLQQHQLTKWILLLHCTQQILSEGIIMIRHKSVSCLNIREHLRLKPWEGVASTLSDEGAGGADNSNPFFSFWSVV